MGATPIKGMHTRDTKQLSSEIKQSINIVCFFLSYKKKIVLILPIKKKKKTFFFLLYSKKEKNMKINKHNHFEKE